MSPDPADPALDGRVLPLGSVGGAPETDASDGKEPASGWREIAGLADAVRALHHQENRGALAALRRMDTARATEPAFQRILAVVARDASHERARRLALLAKILALATGPDMLARGRQNLGDALRAADVSEARVQMLMTARGEALDDLLLRTARRLARDGLLPYEDIGKLILGAQKLVDRTRFRIAKAYWAARRAAAESKSDAIPKPDAGGDE